MSTAKELLDTAFSKVRDPRSPEYKAGVLDVLKLRLGEARNVKCPYELGTANADAYFAGQQEGHQIFRVYLATSAALTPLTGSAVQRCN